MRFAADLHVHSYLSRATSKDLTLEGLYRTAQRKGITVVGTGDFTHPRWLAELRDKLVAAEPGLFALREEIARAAGADVPPACRGPVRFLLQVEISSIYRRGGKVRKVHNLVYAPDFATAGRISARLSRLGNIESDGRPILGVDSRDLLEIVLEASPDAFLVPAHAWTPWFSVLGAQSGFDSIDECYGDLAGEVFAVETGLSSDPAMNWRLSALDRFALVSSSDAHSPEKLGREATLFDGELSYFALRDALRRRTDMFQGTVELFPEEGKYHHDGHRKCGVVLTPPEARAANGACRACGKALTGGVASRVEALADRPAGFHPVGARPYRSLVPLAEIAAEIFGVGVASRRVRALCDRLHARLGSELTVLGETPPEDVAREADVPLLGEALRRVREGRVHAAPGYDGEYGVVHLFAPDELAQRAFAFVASSPLQAPRGAAGEKPLAPQNPEAAAVAASSPSFALSDEQRAVVEHASGPLVVIAGPGTGKTCTIVERIASLVLGGTAPEAITAVTFTRRAAGELRERLGARLGEAGSRIGAETFHSFGLALLRAFPAAAGLPLDFRVLDEEARQALAGDAAEAISLAKSRRLAPGDCDASLAAAYRAYEDALAERHAVDFDDLVVRSVALCASSSEALAWARARCRHLFVDEYQDVSEAQAHLVRLLAADPHANLCAVGDPDQAIYGFRGAMPESLARLTQDYPGARVAMLTRSHRSPATVVRAATAVIAMTPGRSDRPLEPRTAGSPPIERIVAATASEEAHAICTLIEGAVGGTSLLSSGDQPGAPVAFHDIAVLYRLSAQAEPIAGALERAGIPFQRAGEGRLVDEPAIAALVGALAREEAVYEGGGATAIADRIAGLVSRSSDETLCRAADLLAALSLPFGRDARAFLESLALERDPEPRLVPQKVALLTLHASKGLEFPLVIVAGCEDGLLPLRAPGLSTDVEEERRLLYVGMTRARTRLILTQARSRSLFGRPLPGTPSPFLRAVPPILFNERRIARRARPTHQLALL